MPLSPSPITRKKKKECLRTVQYLKGEGVAASTVTTARVEGRAGPARLIKSGSCIRIDQDVVRFGPDTVDMAQKTTNKLRAGHCKVTRNVERLAQNTKKKKTLGGGNGNACSPRTISHAHARTAKLSLLIVIAL